MNDENESQQLEQEDEPMAIYQFNVRDQLGIIADEDGIDLPDILTVAQEAIRSAREFAVDARAPTDMTLEVTDAQGQLVLTVPIRSHVASGHEDELALAS
jgi:hypothetical protein